MSVIARDVQLFTFVDESSRDGYDIKIHLANNNIQCTHFHSRTLEDKASRIEWLSGFFDDTEPAITDGPILMYREINSDGQSDGVCKTIRSYNDLLTSNLFDIYENN